MDKEPKNAMETRGVQKLAELEHRDTPFHVVLDLDRTLFKTNEFVEFIYEVLGHMGIKAIDEFQEHEKANRGNTLDILQELEVFFSDEFSLGRFTAAMQEIEKPSLVYDGVPELLRHFKEQETSFSIMTYGGESTQDLKLMLFYSELGPEFKDIPFEITSVEKNKAAYIDRTWANDDGRFTLPPYVVEGEHTVVDAIVIVDDKPVNFETDNPGIIGVQIGNDGQENSISIPDAVEELTRAA